MGKLLQLFGRIATVACKAYVDYSIERAKRLKLEKEIELATLIEGLLKLKPGKVSIHFKLYDEGPSTLLVTIEGAISQTQLAEADKYLESILPFRQNVRRPTPAVN